MRVLLGIIILSIAVGSGYNEYVGLAVLGVGIVLHGLFCKSPVGWK